MVRSNKKTDKSGILLYCEISDERRNKRNLEKVYCSFHMKILLGNNHWIFPFTGKVVSIKIWQYIWMQADAWLTLYTPTLEITSLDVTVLPKFPSLCSQSQFILPSLNPSLRVNQTAGFPGGISTIYSNQVWNVPQKSNWNFFLNAVEVSAL